MATHQQNLDYAINDFMAWEYDAREEYLRKVAEQFCKDLEKFDANDIDNVKEPAFQRLLKKMSPYLVKDKVIRLKVQELLISRLRNC